MMDKSRYTVEPGRSIYRDGKPFIIVTRDNYGPGLSTISPAQADELTHRIAKFLNTYGAK